jgi:hypothetical protein
MTLMLQAKQNLGKDEQSDQSEDEGWSLTALRGTLQDTLEGIAIATSQQEERQPKVSENIP